MTVKVVIAEINKANMDRIISVCKGDPNIEIIGTTQKGLEAISMTIRRRPNVLILANITDMAIIKIVKKIMQQQPTPILLLKTSLDSIDQLSHILDYGIIDLISAPQKITLSEFSIITRIHILSKLEISKFMDQIEKLNTRGKSLVIAKPEYQKKQKENYQIDQEGKSALSTISQKTSYSGAGRLNKIIIIGTSTGGPRLLNQIIPSLPQNFPPTIVIQHMPVGFIEPLAHRLNRSAAMGVKQAEHGEPITPGMVYIAPAGFHLEIQSTTPTGAPRLSLSDGDEVNFVKPAVDVTLFSASESYRSGAISVILTGMGHDGREGSKMIKENGGKVIALNEEDSDIYGMNKSVIEAGLADEILGINEIVEGIIRAIES